jgi:hypothetical protein
LSYRIELSINKYKPHLKFKESQTHDSLLSLYNINNLTFLTSNNNACAKYSEKDESLVSIQSIIKAFNNNSNKNKLIQSPTPRIKYFVNNKTNTVNTQFKISSDKDQIPKLGNQLINKNCVLKFNLKKLNEINVLKANQKRVNFIKSEVEESKKNSINNGNNRHGSEKLNQRFNTKRIMHKKLNSNFELKSNINIDNQEEKKHPNILPDKKKIIHRISTSIPDLRNFKIVYNSPNTMTQNTVTSINKNQNICYSDNSNKQIGPERIIFVENLNIYNNMNYNSADSSSKNINNFVKSISNLKNFQDIFSTNKKLFNESPFSSTSNGKSQYNGKNQNVNFVDRMKRRSTFSGEYLKKVIVNNNFVRVEDKNADVRLKSKSQKNVPRISELINQEKSFSKTMTKSNFNGTLKINHGVKVDRENLENYVSKVNKVLLNDKPNTNTENNILKTSTSKMKEIKNSVNLF